MSGNPWVRFFPSDWLAGTRGLTCSETGIYISLVAMMYERGGRIKDEPARLARMCGASNSVFKKALETLIAERKIVSEGGYLSNKRVVEELSYSSEKSEVARAAAKSRWAQKPNENNGCDDADAVPAQCDGNANQKPEARDQKEREAPPLSPLATPKRPEPRGARLPDDWLPPPWSDEFAERVGLPVDAVNAEADKFRDYWRAAAGAKGRKLDWDATWRTWVRNAVEYRSKRGPPSGKPQAASLMDAFDELDQRIARHAGLATH